MMVSFWFQVICIYSVKSLSSFAVSDINLNLIDSRIEKRHGTYIPVSNELLRKKFARTSSPLVNKELYEKTDAADDKNTTGMPNATNVRNKRDLPEMTTSLPADNDFTKIPESIKTLSNEIDERNESNIDEQKRSSDSKDNSDNITYPSFHVTYWMFYPYSQVGLIHVLMLKNF